MSVRDRLQDLSDSQYRTARVKIDGRVARVRVPRDASPEEAVAIAKRVAPKSKEQQLNERTSSHPVLGPAVAATAGFSDMMTLGFGDEVGAAMATVNPFNRDSGWRKGFGEGFDKNLARQQEKDELYARRNPKSFLVGQLAGAVLPAFATGGGSIPMTAGKGTALAAAQGGAYGFGSAKGGIAERAKAVPEGAAWGAGGNMAGLALGRAASGLLGGKRLSGAQRALADEDVLLTPGMRGGKVARFVEDKVLGSVPIVDELPKAARERSFASLRKAAANRVLSPLGRQVDDIADLATDTKVGTEFAEKLNRTVYDAYDSTLGNMTLSGSPAMSTAIDDVVNNARLSLTDDEMKVVAANADAMKAKLAKGPLTGKALREQMGELRRRAAELARTERGGVLRELNGVLEDALDAQNGGGASEAYRKAREAVSLLKRYENAASRAGVENAMFGPTQLKQAAQKRGFGTSDASIASGKAPMMDLANNAAEAMRVQTANSGTVPRGLAMTGLLGGSAAGAMVDPVMTGAMLGIPALGYIPGIDRILQNMATKRPAGLLSAGRAIDRNLPYLGLLGMGGSLGLYGRSP